MSGYGSVSSSYYAPDPAMDYWDQKREKELEEAKLFSIYQKYCKDQTLLKQAGFKSVAELVKAYQEMQKYHAFDDERIAQLCCEILELSEMKEGLAKDSDDKDVENWGGEHYETDSV